MKTTKLFMLVSLTSISLLLSSCYSHKKVVQSSLPYSNKVNWPEGYKPSEADFFIHTEIDIKASPQVVWDIFIHAAMKGKRIFERFGFNFTKNTKRKSTQFQTYQQFSRVGV